MLTLGTVVMGASDVRRASAFWCAALGGTERPDADDDWTVVQLPGGGTAVALDLSTSPVQEMPRVHLDLYAGSAAEQAAEVERLVGLGAQRVDWPHYPADPDFVVLADPEGNRFCIVDTSHG